MADVEMDLDPSRSMTQEDHVDQDIIEYDLDTEAMDGMHDEWTAEDLDIQDVDESHVEADPGAQVNMDALHETTEQPADAMDTLDVLPFSGTLGNDADMLSDVGYGEEMLQEDAGELHDADRVGETVVEGLTRAQATSPGPLQRDDQTEEVEEIDFGTVPGEITGADGLPIQGSTAHENSETTADNVPEQEPEMPITAAESGEQALLPVEEELTWEEDDEEKEPGAPLGTVGEQPTDKHPAVSGRPEGSAEPGDGDQEEVGEQDLTGEPASIGSAEDAEDAGAAALLEKSQHEIKVTHDQQNEEDKEREVSPDTTDEGISYPSITVQYKGEEFPCFAASDGFFTSTTVLEESMERLLAGFRAELAAELAPDEELVFHIDELGLEFAESTQHDILAGTTLQYIVEIFEMLVQNQDHDHELGSKKLYTYLFTRSSTSRRLEFLSESAASGKGLDEVIHLFEPAMTHHGVEDSPDHTLAVLDEQGDDYPSPGDEPRPRDGNSDQSEETAPIDAAEHYENEAVNLPAEEAEVGTAGDVEATPVNERLNMPVDGSAEADAVEPVVQPGELEDNNETSQQGSTEAQEEPEAAEPDSFEAHGEPNEYDDGLQAADAPATATSSSSTIDGNEIHPLSAIDENGEGEIDNTLDQPPREDQEDLAEIDWRDGGDGVSGAALEDDQTTPAKRARADDDLGLDEENDAKRQRSS